MPIWVYIVFLVHCLFSIVFLVVFILLLFSFRFFLRVRLLRLFNKDRVLAYAIKSTVQLHQLLVYHFPVLHFQSARLQHCFIGPCCISVFQHSRNSVTYGSLSLCIKYNDYDSHYRYLQEGLCRLLSLWLTLLSRRHAYKGKGKGAYSS